MKKIATIATLALVVIALSIFAGYRFYKQSLFRDKLNEALGKDSAYAETILRLEIESSKMTVGEAIQLFDTSIEKRQELILELRGLYPGVNDALKEELVAFLAEENEFIRAKRRLYQKSIELISQMSVMEQFSKRIRTSLFSRSSLKAEAVDLIDHFAEICDDLIQESKDFKQSCSDMVIKEEAISRNGRKFNISINPVFSKFEKTNIQAAKKALDSAASVKETLKEFLEDIKAMKT
jgi:hypothetical protein